MWLATSTARTSSWPAAPEPARRTAPPFLHDYKELKTSELAGKVAIVTGGASGMGRESVRKFHAEGATVVIADVSDDAGAQLAAELGDLVHFHRCNVSQAEEVRGLVDTCIKHFGQLDVMFNNAGITGDTRHVDFFDDGFHDLLRTVSVDLLGVMLGCRFAGKAMAQRGSGSII